MAAKSTLSEIPDLLVEELARGNVVLLVGAGLSIGAGLPSWSKLVSPLADEIGLDPQLRANPLKVAQYFQNERGRQALVVHVRELTDTAEKDPTDVHRQLLQLPCKIWLTTNYDDLLEKTLMGAHRKFDLVVRDLNLPYTREGALTLIKFHGDRALQDTLIITERDYQTYFRRYPRVRDKLSDLLVTRTFLLIGYSASDPDFNQILAEISDDVGEHQRRAYAILINADRHTVKDLEARNITVLELAVRGGEDPSARVGEMLAALIRRVSARIQVRALPSAEELEDLAGRIAQAVKQYRHQMDHVLKARPEIEQPYRELLPFRIEDQRIFFGRDESRDQMYHHMLKDRLTVLSAKSGAGKTSLLNAGLTPLLIKEGHVPVYIRDYDDAVAAIKRAIVPEYDDWPAAWQTRSLTDFLGLVCRQLGDPKRELVLILDQFEELLMLQPETEPRRKFVEALVRCYDDRALPIRIVIAVRKDYFHDLTALKPNLPNVLDNLCTLEPMTRRQAEKAITGPIEALGRKVSYESCLLDDLLKDLEAGGMELPHLQIICSRLFDEVSGKEAMEEPVIITLEVYERLGGREGIWSSYLNKVLEGLGPIDEAIAKRILVSFVSSEPTREPTRQVLKENELAARIEAEHWGSVRGVLDGLVRARLLQCNQTGDDRRYEMAHEYLSDEIRSWLTVEDWDRKKLEERLRGEVASWRDDRTPIPADRLARFENKRNLLVGLDADAVRCLLGSALAMGKKLEDWEEVAGGAAAMQQALADIAVDTTVEVKLRAAAADAIDGLNGSRAGLGLTPKDLPDIEWCTVPAGEFLAGNAEPPQIKAVDRPYLIGKHPITNAQFEAFVRDEGANPDHTRLGGGFDRPSHPVAKVGFDEALAFCRWLSKKLNQAIDLPTEAQWEKAARGTDGRLYPWGNKIEAGDKCANYDQTGIGCTTSAGIFPAGASPYGVEDMSGNAWEWCRDDKDPDAGVLRGGSHNLSADYMRCDYRIKRSVWEKTAVGFRAVSYPTGQEV